MIAYLKGKITSLTPSSAVVETSGVGYVCKIPLSVYERLKKDQEAQLLVHHHFREDAQTLFGFLEQEEKETFEALLSVAGIGGNTALTILSSMTAREFQDAVASGDAERFKQVKGVGKKTAERLILELKDKLSGLPSPEESHGAPPANNNSRNEALKALVNLGFSRAEADKKLRSAAAKLTSGQPSAEELIKFALQN